MARKQKSKYNMNAISGDAWIVINREKYAPTHTEKAISMKRYV